MLWGPWSGIKTVAVRSINLSLGLHRWKIVAAPYPACGPCVQARPLHMYALAVFPLLPTRDGNYK